MAEYNCRLIQRKIKGVTMEKSDIFISYRRQGGEFPGMMIRDALVRRGYDVFFDVESMHQGAFSDQIRTAIKNCSDFLLILSPGTLDRCCNENDWVRYEIEYAIQCGKQIIPVMTSDFTWPEQLPESIVAVKYSHGIVVQGALFDAALTKLEFLMNAGKRKVICDKNQELEMKEYYPVKTPFINRYSGKAECCGFWFIEVAAKSQEYFVNYDNETENEFQESLNHFMNTDWFLHNQEKLENLKLRIEKFTEYGNTDVFFYVYCVSYLYGLRRVYMQEKMKEPYGMVQNLPSFETIKYLLGWDGASALKEVNMDYNQLFNLMFDDFRDNIMYPFVNWKSILEQKSTYTVEERREFTNYAIRLFDVMVDLALFGISHYRNPAFVEPVRTHILCHYKYLKKHKIYLPKEIQKKVYEL